jgi:hypothetical protein
MQDIKCPKCGSLVAKGDRKKIEIIVKGGKKFVFMGNDLGMLADCPSDNCNRSISVNLVNGELEFEEFVPKADEPVEEEPVEEDEPEEEPVEEPKEEEPTPEEPKEEPKEEEPKDEPEEEPAEPKADPEPKPRFIKK